VVHPFASLTELVPETCPRVLINLEPAGDIGDRPDDVVIIGKCDHVIQQLCKLLQWGEELETLWEATKDSVELEEDASEESPLDLEAEVQKLAEEVEESLKLSVKLRESTEKVVKRDTTETPEDGDRVILRPAVDEKEAESTVMTKATDRTEPNKQDTKHDDSRRPDTRHAQTLDDGDTQDDNQKPGKL
jgi:NAD-dependent protein deacetylase SIR2